MAPQQKKLRATRAFRCFRLSLFCVMLTALPTVALAHRERMGGATPADAILTPSLTHGQMKVIADNLSAIRAAAETQFPTDPTMRRLQNYVNLQLFACFWGMVPGSLNDESSPFNECAHAYLAGALALLLHLQCMPAGNRLPVEALVHKIEVEMLANDAALSLCRYSDEPFNTAEIIAPHWQEIPLHAPTVMTFVAVLASAIAGAVGLPRIVNASSREA